MANYFYSAKTLNGINQKGVMEAKDEYQLSRDLRDKGMILIKASLEDLENKGLKMNIPSFFVSLKEKMMMTRNLWVMVSTGLPIVKSFSLLANQTKNTKLKKALLQAKDDVGKGISMSDALAKHPDIFSDLFLNMIKVGEESGTLEDVLKILCLQMEKEYQLKSKIQAAMMYPSVIMGAMGMIGTIIVIFVFPKLTEFFNGLHAKLPFYTKIIIFLGNFFVAYWWLVLIGFGVLAFFLWLGLRTKQGKWLLDTILIKAPIVSSLVKKNNAAIFIRSLSSLNASGVPLVRSLEIISGTVGNYYFKKAIVNAAEKIKKGEKLSAAISVDKNIFPFGAIEIIEVGEETGKSSLILKKLADFYEEEVISIAENLSAVIEPLLILVLGGCVALFAFSVIEPMYSVLSNV